MKRTRLTYLEDCRTPEEREFALALLARAERDDWYGDLWFSADPLISSVDVCDGSQILRTLRVDFYGTRVVVGRDPTGQFGTDLDPASPGVHALESGSVAELAQFAADWLEKELRRPIDRLEWPISAPGCKLWVMADTGEGLVETGRRPKLLRWLVRRMRVRAST